MNALRRLLRNRTLIAVIGFLFLVALIWLVMGWWLGLGMVTCLVTTCGLLLLLVVFLLANQAGAQRGARKIEQSFYDQGEEQKNSTRLDKRAQIEEIRKRLLDAIRKLKESKLGSAALYKVPWYILIGPPGSGKTTAIRNAGIEFPYETDGDLKGIGGTRNCDWWFSNDAVLVDTAGRYTTLEDDQEVWLRFLDDLRKHRRKRPINGILVCISIADLLGVGTEKLDEHARKIRARIDEITRRLGFLFPIYLLFTKCDLIDGFVEFFGDLNRGEREQVWGCTLGATDIEAGTPRALFDREFRVLYEPLVQRRITRFSTGVERQDRSRVFAFPAQCHAARESLVYFVGKVFQVDRYQDSPIFRGFYFTSGTQEGVPIDNVIKAIAEGCGIPGNGGVRSVLQPKSYFLKDLFTEILGRGDQFIRRTRREARRHRLVKAEVSITAVLALGMFILGVSQAYLRSREMLKETERVISNFNTLPVARAANLEELDPLLARIRLLRAPPLFLFGMDRSEDLLAPLEELYFARVRPAAESLLVDGLEERCRPGVSTRPFDDLKAYLLLTKELPRLRDNQKYRDFLKNHIRTLTDNARETSHLDYFVDHFGMAVEEGLAKDMPADESLISRWRFEIVKPPDAFSIYSQMKGQAIAERFDATSLLGNVLSSQNPTVAGGFTRVGAQQMEQIIGNWKGKDLQEDAEWVLGGDAAGKLQLLPDDGMMQDSLRRMYYREYAGIWWNFLGGLSVFDFKDLYDATTRLEVLSDPNNSPLKLISMAVVQQTRFNPPPGNQIGQAVNQVQALTGTGPASMIVDNDLADFYAFVGDPAKPGSSELATTLGDFRAIRDALASISPTGPSQLGDFAKRVFEGSSPLVQSDNRLTNSASGKDQRLRALLGRIGELTVLYSWRTVLSKARDEVNNEWNANAYAPYQQISRKFPFYADSPDDAPITVVRRMLGPEGIARVTSYLDPFLDGNGVPKRWKDWGLTIPLAARAALARARTLSGAFMQEGGNFGLALSLSIDSQRFWDPDGRVDAIIIDVSGDTWTWEVNSNHRKFDFKWVGGDVSIKLVDRPGGIWPWGHEQQVDRKWYEGDWALFRLILKDAKEAYQGSTLEYACEWEFQYGIRLKASVRNAAGGSNPFTQRLELELPEKLVE